MNPDPGRAAELFDHALDLETSEREIFLNGACGNDVDLRRRVENLLQAHHTKSGFLPEGQDGSSGGSDGQLARALLLIGSPSHEAAGTVIDRYKLLEKIGEGGFGAVWAAEQRQPVKRRVALKIIKLGMDTKQVVARFEAERQALALMNHPNIAKVLDAGSTDSGRPYFVMELVHGVPITTYCDQERFSTTRRLVLFMKVCHAIQHAHQKGIIHRDLKPSNILVTLHDGVPVPKVIDFGIAKATQQELTEKTIYTQFQHVIGTPAYMSPEQAEMSGLDIDTRSDIYTLGVLLYELLTGCTPFNSEELVRSGLDEMRKIIREREPVTPSKKIATMPKAKTTTSPRRDRDYYKLVYTLRGDLDWITMKCLEKDRTRRYQTANGLAMDVQRLLRNEPVVARPPSAAYRLQKAVGRHRLEFFSAAAIAVALIGGIALASIQAIRARHAEAEQLRLRILAQRNELDAQRAQRRAEQTKDRLRHRVYAADINLAHHALEQNNLGRARQLLSKHIPEEGELDLRGFEWRNLWRRGRGDAEHIFFAHDYAATCVVFSPNGKTLASSGFDNTTRVWEMEADGSIVLSRSFEGGWGRDSIAFSSHGDLLAVGIQGAVIIKEVGTWEKRKQYGPISFIPGRRWSPIVFMQKDRWIATQVPEGVALWDLTSDEQRIITGLGATFGDLMAFSSNADCLAIASHNCIHLWDVNSQTLLPTIRENDSPIKSLISFDRGSLLMAGLDDGSVTLIDVAERRSSRTWQGHSGPTYALAASRDGKMLATGGADQLIRLWDLNSSTNSSTGPDLLRTLRGHENQVWALSFAPDGRQLASASKDGRVALWKVETGEEQSTSSKHPPVHFEPLPPDTPFGRFSGQDVRSPDGTIIARAREQDGHLVELRDADTDKLLHTLKNQMNVASMAFSPSGRLFATGSHANQIRIWKTTSGEAERLLLGHMAAVSALAFSPDGQTLVSGATDGTVKLWSVSTGYEMISRSFSRGPVADLKFSKDGQVLGIQFNDSDPSNEYFRAPSWHEIEAAQMEGQAALFGKPF